MTKKFRELEVKMSAESRARSDAKTQKMIEEMALNELRQAMGITQERLAKALRINQAGSGGRAFASSSRGACSAATFALPTTRDSAPRKSCCIATVSSRNKTAGSTEWLRKKVDQLLTRDDVLKCLKEIRVLQDKPGSGV